MKEASHHRLRVLPLRDVWWMLGTSLLLFPLLRSGMRIVAWEGGLMVALYATYLLFLIL